MKPLDHLELTVVCVVIALLILETIDGVAITDLKRAEREDRQLIAQVEANYATNEDFRRLCK